MLRVVTYVVPYQLFGIELALCDLTVSQEDWFDKGFVIWHFLDYCLAPIVLLWSLSIGVRTIFTTTESIDKIRDLKLNASQNNQEKNNMKKMRRRPDFLWNTVTIRSGQDSSNKMRRRPIFLIESWWAVRHIDIVCNSLFTNQSTFISWWTRLIYLSHELMS